MRRRRIVRRAGARAARRWTANLVAESYIGGTINATQTTDIVTPVDYQQSPSLEQGGLTLVRLRGWLSFSADIVTNNSGVLWMYLAIYDFDHTAGGTSPTAAQTYIDEDIIWSGGCRVSKKATGVDQARFDWDIDVKVKRRLSDHVVRLNSVYAGNAADDAGLNGTIRALLIGG